MSAESTNTSKNNSGSARKLLLFGVLGLLLVALAYDYSVARPSVELAYDQIVERSAEVNAQSTLVFTNLDVRKLLGKEPSKTFVDEGNGDMVEVFSWRSGLPIKTHDLFAVYKLNNGKKLFYRHARYKYETSKEVSDYSVVSVVEGADSPEVDAAYEAQMNEEEGGGGGPGGGGGGPGGGGGGGFDPEAFFAERDADGDGFLKDDEISDRLRENLTETDTDADGAVSKDEWMARIAARRAAGGGRRGGGPGAEGSAEPRGGDGGRRSRPELETDDEAAAAPEKAESEAESAEAEKPEAESAEAESAEAEGAEAEKPEASESDE